MSRINKVPQGLQSLLASQNLGVNPSELSPVVTPTVDLLPFWTLGTIQTFTSAVSLDPVAVGAGGVLWSKAIPAAEAWFIVGLGMVYTLPATGNQFKASWAMRNQINVQTDGAPLAVNTILPFGPENRVNCQNLGALGSYAVMNKFDVPLIARGGEEILFLTGDETSPALQNGVRPVIRYYSVQI